MCDQAIASDSKSNALYAKQFQITTGLNSIRFETQYQNPCAGKADGRDAHDGCAWSGRLTGVMSVMGAMGVTSVT